MADILFVWIPILLQLCIQIFIKHTRAKKVNLSLNQLNEYHTPQNLLYTKVKCKQI